MATGSMGQGPRVHGPGPRVPRFQGSKGPWFTPFSAVSRRFQQFSTVFSNFPPFSAISAVFSNFPVFFRCFPVFSGVFRWFIGVFPVFFRVLPCFTAVLPCSTPKSQLLPTTFLNSQFAEISTFTYHFYKFIIFRA